MILQDNFSFCSVSLKYIFPTVAFSLAVEPINFALQMSDKQIAVTKTSPRGSLLRITAPKEIAEKLNVSESEHIGFYDVNGEIVVRKIE